MRLRGFATLQLRRVRAAYASISHHVSPRPGYAGMIEEMQWGHEHLDDGARFETDERVLEKMFFSPVGTWTLKTGWKLAPWVMTRVMPAAAPTALSWLVGPVEVRGGQNLIPVCKFRKEGGPEICEHVCRRPSESFCSRRAVPVRLQPDPDSLSCTWTWGVE